MRLSAGGAHLVSRRRSPSSPAVSSPLWRCRRRAREGGSGACDSVGDHFGGVRGGRESQIRDDIRQAGLKAPSALLKVPVGVRNVPCQENKMKVARHCRGALGCAMSGRAPAYAGGSADTSTRRVDPSEAQPLRASFAVSERMIIHNQAHNSHQLSTSLYNFVQLFVMCKSAGCTTPVICFDPPTWRAASQSLSLHRSRIAPPPRTCTRLPGGRI